LDLANDITKPRHSLEKMQVLAVENPLYSSAAWINNLDLQFF